MSDGPAIFQTTLRRGIWRVTLNGAFYGDYRTERHATESVDTAARGLRGNGRVVQIAPQASA